jgi:hypothetical protein
MKLTIMNQILNKNYIVVLAHTKVISNSVKDIFYPTCEPTMDGPLGFKPQATHPELLCGARKAMSMLLEEVAWL